MRLSIWPNVIVVYGIRSLKNHKSNISEDHILIPSTDNGVQFTNITRISTFFRTRDENVNIYEGFFSENDTCLTHIRTEAQKKAVSHVVDFCTRTRSKLYESCKIFF